MCGGFLRMTLTEGRITLVKLLMRKGINYQGLRKIATDSEIIIACREELKK
jgi:hypothetical protein